MLFYFTFKEFPGKIAQTGACVNIIYMPLLTPYRERNSEGVYNVNIVALYLQEAKMKNRDTIKEQQQIHFSS